MIKFTLTLIVSLLLFISIGWSKNSEKQRPDISPEQLQLSVILQSNKYIFDADWIDIYTLQVIYDSAISDEITKKVAENEAELIATLGYLYTSKDICVRLLQPNKIELASKCVGKRFGL